MAIILNVAAERNAERLINAGEVETFDANWDEERPTDDEVNNFIDTHTLSEYGLWFLGKNSEYPAEVKEHYVYPCGDLKEVQRCALLDTIECAGRDGDQEIVQAAKRLLALIKD